MIAMADNIAQPLKLWRRRVGLTQEEVAARLGIDPDRYAKWEQGKASPKQPQLRDLMKLGFSLIPGQNVMIDEMPSFMRQTSPVQLVILIETIYDCNRDPDLRASARNELFRLLELPG